MFRITKFVIACFVFCLLVSCYKWTYVNNEQDEKRIRAARLNIQLGMAYLERKDVRRAKHKFLLALDEAPGLPEPWYGMGFFLETTGNMEKAETYYLKAITLAPLRGDALNNYGTYLCRRGRYRQAIQYFIDAVKDPQYLEPAAAYENAGMCALKIPNKKMALQFFMRVMMEDPHRPNSLIELAELNYERKQYMLAKKQVRQFLQLSPPTTQSFLLENKIDAQLNAN